MAAYQGRAAEASALIAASEADWTNRRGRTGTQNAALMKAILHNGLGQDADALAAAELAVGGVELPNDQLALPELIESAVGSGKAELARDALRWLSMQTIKGANWAEGIEARSQGAGDRRRRRRALVRRGGRAARLLRFGTQLARAHLLYGEWLRREGRRVDAHRRLRSPSERQR